MSKKGDIYTILITTQGMEDWAHCIVGYSTSHSDVYGRFWQMQYSHL